MSDLKMNNRRHILELIEKENLSRKDISIELGLTPAAVTILTNEMMQEGWLMESGEKASDASVGRKKVMLTINKGYKYVLGISLEPGQYQIGISNLVYESVGHFIGYFENEKPVEQLQVIINACVNLMWQCEILKSDLIGVGIGIVGAVENGTSLHAYGLWDEQVPIEEQLRKEFNVPVYVENNVRALAEAELQLIEHGVIHNMCFIKYGPGIGAAMIINGELYSGSRNLAGEIGHSIVVPDGELCSCGKRGCLETIASIKSICKKLGIRKAALISGYQEGQADIVEVVNTAMDYFSLAIGNMITLYDPNHVVIYSEIIDALGLIDYIKDKVSEYYCYEQKDISFELSGLSKYNASDKSVAGIAVALKHLFYRKGGLI